MSRLTALLLKWKVATTVFMTDILIGNFLPFTLLSMPFLMKIHTLRCTQTPINDKGYRHTFILTPLRASPIFPCSILSK